MITYTRLTFNERLVKAIDKAISGLVIDNVIRVISRDSVLVIGEIEDDFGNEHTFRLEVFPTVTKNG